VLLIRVDCFFSAWKVKLEGKALEAENERLTQDIARLKQMITLKREMIMA
jgi:hypothetical protein